jgi:hypothetical protein
MSIADPAAYKAFDDRKPAAYCLRSKRSTEVCLEQVSVFGIFVISALGFPYRCRSALLVMKSARCSFVSMVCGAAGGRVHFPVAGQSL